MSLGSWTGLDKVFDSIADGISSLWNGGNDPDDSPEPIANAEPIKIPNPYDPTNMATLTPTSNAQSGSFWQTLLNTAVDIGTDYLMYDRQRDDSDHNARDARAWQAAMIDQANAYNTPKAQMARLQDAGLNPRLIYEQINNVGWQGPPAPVVAETPHLNSPRPDILGQLREYQNLRNMAVQGNILGEQYRMTKANADIAEMDAKYTKESGLSPRMGAYDKSLNFLKRAWLDLYRVSDDLNFLPRDIRHEFNYKKKVQDDRYGNHRFTLEQKKRD